MKRYDYYDEVEKSVSAYIAEYEERVSDILCGNPKKFDELWSLGYVEEMHDLLWDNPEITTNIEGIVPTYKIVEENEDMLEAMCVDQDLNFEEIKNLEDEKKDNLLREYVLYAAIENALGKFFGIADVAKEAQ